MKLKVVSKVSAKALNALGTKGLVIRQHSPEILLGLGIVGVVAGSVLTARQTLKLEKNLDIHNEEIENASDDKEMAAVYIRTGFRVVKLYAPAAAASVIGMACIIGAHNIQAGRIAGLSAAYTGLSAAYEAYRDRVREEVGEERELELRRGCIKIEDEEVTLTKSGKEKTTKSVHDYLQPGQAGLFTFIFDESNAEFSKTPLYNKDFLVHKQNIWNDTYNARGYVFLNDVLEDLGFDTANLMYTRTVGWCKGMGDDYIDFGMFEAGNIAKRDFANGYLPAIWLDFNVDGVIIDKIGVGLPSGILDPELEYELHMREVVDEMAENEIEKEIDTNA